MRFFSLLDFQTVLLLTFLGLLVLVLLYVALGGQTPSKVSREGKEDEEELPEGIKAKRNPVPLILVFVYLGFIAWVVGYVIMVGLRGGPF
jgi:hypothetical protein